MSEKESTHGYDPFGSRIYFRSPQKRPEKYRVWHGVKGHMTSTYTTNYLWAAKREAKRLMRMGYYVEVIDNTHSVRRS